jgi:hypothetical protein
MILTAPTNSFAAARERLGPHGQRGLAMSQLSTYPLETLWDDAELVLSRSLPDSEGKRMSKAYLQVSPASSRWCRPWRRAPPAATVRPNNQLPVRGVP